MHSNYIIQMSKKTGRTRRELEWLWKKAESMIKFDQMMNPQKYTMLVSDVMDVDVGNTNRLYTQIAGAFEKLISGDDPMKEEVKSENLEDSMESDIESTLQDDVTESDIDTTSDITSDTTPEVDEIPETDEGFEDFIEELIGDPE